MSGHDMYINMHNGISDNLGHSRPNSSDAVSLSNLKTTYHSKTESIAHTSVNLDVHNNSVVNLGLVTTHTL